MLDPSWLDNQGSHRSLNDLFAHLDRQLPFQDIGDLIFVPMRMRRSGKGVGGNGMFHKRQCPIGLLPHVFVDRSGATKWTDLPSSGKTTSPDMSCTPFA